MLRNPPSLIRIGNGSAKYEPRPITAARRPSRRMLPLLLVAFVLSYIAYTHLSGNGALPSMKAGKTSTSSFIRNGGNSGRDLPPAEVELEPRAHKLELVSPMYNIKVLRSILQHSNTSWQDKPKEAHGYFVQSLVWFQNVSLLYRLLALAALEAHVSFSKDRRLKARYTCRLYDNSMQLPRSGALVIFK